MKYFADVAKTLNSSLLTNQREKPMVPFLADSLEGILGTFSAEKTHLKANTSLKLIKLDFKDATIHKQSGDVVGFTQVRFKYP